jgi:hypothetical protein
MAIVGPLPDREDSAEHPIYQALRRHIQLYLLAQRSERKHTEGRAGGVSGADTGGVRFGERE